MINVRPYKPSDFAAALAVINAAAAVDHTRRFSDTVFRRALAGDLASQAAVAVDHHTINGFVWWDAHRGDLRLEGWVHPECRRNGIGTALLTAVESTVRRTEALPVILTARCYNDIPGSEALFRLRGFQEIRRFYMMSTQLHGRDYDVAAPPGITLRSFQPGDLPGLVEADNEIFAEHWGSHPRPLQTWKREMIDLRPHDPGLWVLAFAGEHRDRHADQADQIVGECLCHLSTQFGPTDGWISIVGVRKEWRGRGIGRAVLLQGLRNLQKAGFVTGSLHVDAENTPAVNLYRAVGMEISRTRLHFAKTVGY